MTRPRVNAPVRGSRTGRPIMVLLNALGRRWALRVLWELRDEPQTFRALRDRCEDVSPTVLNDRLAELRDLGLVQATDLGYTLTEQGRALGALLLPLDAFARRWARGRG
jgi:DNA-binding HxlR family transcriptional regulator